jgi:hypothetical protein
MIANISKHGQDDFGSGPPPEIIEVLGDIWEKIIQFCVLFGALNVSEVS